MWWWPAWGLVLYQGVIDPPGGHQPPSGPSFGLANQSFAFVNCASVSATTFAIKIGKGPRYSFYYNCFRCFLWLLVTFFSRLHEEFPRLNPDLGPFSQSRAFLAIQKSAETADVPGARGGAEFGGN